MSPAHGCEKAGGFTYTHTHTWTGAGKEGSRPRFDPSERKGPSRFETLSDALVAWLLATPSLFLDLWPGPRPNLAFDAHFRASSRLASRRPATTNAPDQNRSWRDPRTSPCFGVRIWSWRG